MARWAICIVVLLFSWVPQVMAAGSSYVVIDAKTGRVLQGIYEQERLPIASLTKIWTALVVIENSDLQQQVRISKAATLAEGSSIYLVQDELVTIEQLLHGLLLRSGNDAALALAETVGGSVEGFVKLMNDYAQVRGLSHTTFMNPSGLHDPQHLSTAYDTARMLQIAMRNPIFAQIASAQRFKGPYIWHNKHRLIHENIGVTAGKTGYTKVAGRTLATFFERGEKQFIIVTLNESNDWVFHRAIADAVDANYDMHTVAKRGKYTVGPVKVKLQQPIRLLLSKQERPVNHVLQVRRNSSQVLWHVYIGKHRVYSELVTRE